SRFYAEMYKRDGLTGGHIILLNGTDSPYYDATKEQALLAIESYRGGLQVGGGINVNNAKSYLEEGASHVIVTSFVFKDGNINYDNLIRLSRVTGKDRLVLDVSCRKKDGKYYIVTDRWQKFTDVALSEDVFYRLADYCDEFLIHAVDVEGKANGIEEELAEMMGKLAGFKMTYAGGISTMKDIEKLKSLGKGAIDFTVGSALDIFGGELPYDEIKKLR
ncbi:MAG: phosphoribosylformimino-5-aminoimidazole carboxamide ribotide isomerase, partial [Lachnospiraceae bacterium]